MISKNIPYIATTTLKLESGIFIMAAGAIVDGEVEFYELAGIISEDNMMEIIEKFKEHCEESCIDLQ